VSPAPAPDTTVDPARPRSAGPDDDERTVVLQPRKLESTVRLERTAPKGTEETIPLDRPSLLLGRGHGCDVKLRTPTASREHAKIVFKGGQWMISGVEGKSFYADGARQAAEVALRGGMRIRLGDDEFEVVDTAGGAASRSGGGVWARITAFVRGLFGRRA
jgi:pSer/pThr/pTyr-binding forkhead associated (FHA) protein